MSHSSNVTFDEYGIRLNEDYSLNSSATSYDLDITPADNNYGGWGIITGTISGTTDSSGIEVRCYQGNTLRPVKYRTTNSATTGSNYSTNSNGCPMNYYSIGNLNYTSRNGERSNFMIFFFHNNTAFREDFFYGQNHYLSTSGTTHTTRFAASVVGDSKISKLRFQRWNGASFVGRFMYHRIGELII